MAGYEVSPRIDPEDREGLPSIDALLRIDTHPVPDHYFERSPLAPSSEIFAPELFTSKDWHRKEVEGVWKKAWQVACWVNELPKVGDYTVYDIADQSIIVSRGKDMQVRAFYNACQHRGTMLATGHGNTQGFVCSFHGWGYGLDGSLKRLPCKWDFPGVDQSKSGLREVKCQTWNGCVWINLDPQAEPLEAFLGPDIVGPWSRWNRDHYQKIGHVGKIMPCNWKLAMHAFIELYHFAATHPQALGLATDINAHYDVFGPHGRVLTCSAVPSPYLRKNDDQQAMVKEMITAATFNIFGEDAKLEIPIPRIPAGVHARQFLGEMSRNMFTELTGVSHAGRSDSEVLDTIDYAIFPNTILFGGWTYTMAYRVRPNGNDPESCLFEEIILREVPADKPLEKDVQMRLLKADEKWASAQELGGLGPVTDQDAFNLERIQVGMHSDGLRALRFASYQESLCRNHLSHIVRWASRGGP